MRVLAVLDRFRPVEVVGGIARKPSRWEGPDKELTPRFRAAPQPLDTPPLAYHAAEATLGPSDREGALSQVPPRPYR